MKRIKSYHKVRGFKSIEEYKNYYRELGMKEFIDAIQVSGVLINTYDKKEEENKIISEMGIYLKDEPEYYRWEKLINESKVINNLYQDLYDLESYKIAEKVPKEESFTSFVIVLEKFIQSLKIDYTKDKGDDQGVKLSFLTDFSFKSNMSPVEKTLKIADHILFISDMILKYLLFYKCKNVDNVLETNDEFQRASFEHLVVADRKDVVHMIDNEWRFFNRTIMNNGNFIESYCNSNEFLDYHIIKNRLQDRKNKILNSLNIGEDFEGVISEEKGISDEEKYSILYLKEILSIENLNYTCSINKKDGTAHKVYLNNLVRAYAVIKQMVDTFVRKKQKYSNKLLDNCLIIEEKDIFKEFVKNEISEEQAQILIKVLRYENYKDILDTPLVPFNKQIMLIPGIVQSIDISQVVLSCVNQFNFQGEAFEKLILKVLQKAGIKAISKNYRDETGEYQCDVLFGIKRTLFVCECKAWGEPHSIISYCERNNKCFDAYTQLNRITLRYQEIKDEISRELGMLDGIIRIKKIVILSNAVGIENKIEDVYFVDFSTFNLFIKREKPSINLYHKKITYQYFLPGFNELEGKITENKLLKYITNSSAVHLTIKNTERQIREMPLLNYSIKYNTYILKENQHLMPDKDVDEYLNNLEKIYSLN